MNYQLDLTTYACPLPLLMTKKALITLEQGDKLDVLLASPYLTDFELLAQELGIILYHDITLEGIYLLKFQR